VRSIRLAHMARSEMHGFAPRGEAIVRQVVDCTGRSLAPKDPTCAPTLLPSRNRRGVAWIRLLRTVVAAVAASFLTVTSCSHSSAASASTAELPRTYAMADSLELVGLFYFLPPPTLTEDGDSTPPLMPGEAPVVYNWVDVASMKDLVGRKGVPCATPSPSSGSGLSMRIAPDYSMRIECLQGAGESIVSVGGNQYHDKRLAFAIMRPISEAGNLSYFQVTGMPDPIPGTLCLLFDEYVPDPRQCATRLVAEVMTSEVNDRLMLVTFESSGDIVISVGQCSG